MLKCYYIGGYMKEVNLYLNNDCLNKGPFNTTIFLNYVRDLILIHLVEYEDNNFKRRIEFKKYKYNNYKYLSFSILTLPNFSFSGNITFLPNNEILTGTIEFQILKSNSTRIIETYYLKIDETKYELTHFLNQNITENTILQESRPDLSLSNIDIFLFNIITIINNLCSASNKANIPTNLNLNSILNEEQQIINMLKEKEIYFPKLSDYLNEYQLTRKRTK